MQVVGGQLVCWNDGKDFTDPGITVGERPGRERRGHVTEGLVGSYHGFGVTLSEMRNIDVLSTG